MGRRGKLPFAPWGERDHPEADADTDARFKWGLTEHYVDGETVALAEDDPRLDGRVFLGKTLSELIRIVVQIIIILSLGIIRGANVATGLIGAVANIGIAIRLSLWFLAFSNTIALITRDPESTIIAANMLQLPLLFVSSAFLPVGSIPSYIQTVATYNPITYGVDATRAIMLNADVIAVLDVTTFGGSGTRSSRRWQSWWSSTCSGRRRCLHDQSRLECERPMIAQLADTIAQRGRYTISTPVNSNRAPPSRLSVTAMSQPWASAIRSTIVSPSPVPSVVVV